MDVWIMMMKMSDLFDQNSECECMPETEQGCCVGVQDGRTGAMPTELTFLNEPTPNAPIDEARPYNISIEPLHYGYLVRVGCQSVAIENKKSLIEKLTAYLYNPGEFQKKWYTDRESLMS